ncbi:MAG: hypothetical protein ACXV8W_11415 [Methylobacter sp.]
MRLFNWSHNAHRSDVLSDRYIVPVFGVFNEGLFILYSYGSGQHRATLLNNYEQVVHEDVDNIAI